MLVLKRHKKKASGNKLPPIPQRDHIAKFLAKIQPRHDRPPVKVSLPKLKCLEETLDG